MSKTYYTRRSIRESMPIVEYHQDYRNDWTGKIIKAGATKKYDCTNTTDGDGYDRNYISRINSRHPNKKKSRKLLKEFREMGVNYIGMFNDKFDHRKGDINDRRKRKATECIENAKRRFKLKLQAKKIIEEGIYEYNRENY